MRLFDPDKMPEALTAVHSVVEAHGLQVYYDSHYVAIYNDYIFARICEIDQGTTDWEFRSRISSSNAYQFGDYRSIVLGLSRLEVANGIELLSEDRPAGDLEYIARVIVKHLQRPLNGDYSWREEYVSRIRDASRFYNFKRKPPADLDIRGKQVVEMLLWRREGALEATEAYFAEVWPENGWEFASTEAEVLRSRLRC